MPVVDSAHIFFIASIIEVLTQILKGPFPEEYREYIPYALMFVGLFLGLGFGVYYAADPVVSVFEGFFGAATALGFYQVASRVPAVKLAFGSKGWLKDNG